MKELRKLCTPAYLYFLISFFSILILAYQNMGHVDKYCVGNFQCRVTNTLAVFVAKMLYVMFWTWMLSVFCKAGYTNVAWFLLLLPYIMMFILIAALLLYQA